jgi:SAM-dependent methyltransferase
LAYPNAGHWNKFWENALGNRALRPSFSKKRLLHLLQPYVARTKRALDAGCGSGFFSKFFCDEGMETVSLDYSTQALALTKEMTQGRSGLIQADILNPDITGEIAQRFDLIFTDGLLEHFDGDDQNLIMLNLKRLLDEGGVIVTVVPNKFSPWELIRPLYMPGIEEKPFVLKELRSLNERNGLVILRSGGVNVWPFYGSPDAWLGGRVGMLLYTIAKAHEPPQS